MTNRQQDALELAYRSGYYEAPRQISGEELAEELNISSGTFYQHLRRAHQNLIDAVFQLNLDSGASKQCDEMSTQ
ncbi:HTH domain-containing protein [Salinadaptatus halalkaliphilus]|uniref:HTH domain-containing protein n=1 Tax=Salinadaptatus halalkaliphilus TaxID=2419781 RepID=A0A4S3TJT7_9EURY|nr:HTH domain-containing protein [Salinadaptatus halalkaliphilus]